MRSSDHPEFHQRNGFARQGDLGSARLRELLDLCFRELRAFSGETSLDWSRQWEYPFALGNLPEAGSGRRLLDAGSGYRFFTPLLASRGFEVDACDLDASAGRRLERFAAERGLRIRFGKEDLTGLSYGDAAFDFVTCISVLEHTRDPAAVAAEFHRCLRPGGTLVLTFDVSIDGDRDIPIPAAKRLLETLEARFELTRPFADRGLFEGSALRDSPDVLRTRWFREHRPELLPWGWISRATLQNLARGRVGRPFFDLAVVGLALRKPER